MTCELSRDLLDAYLDGEIDLVRSLEIEQHLKECTRCAQAYERRRSFISALKLAPLAYQVPVGLEQNVRTAVRRSAGPEAALTSKRAWTFVWPWNSWVYNWMGAGVMALMVLTVIPRISGLSAEDRLGQEIVGAHVRSLMASHLIDIQTSNQHVVKPWFNGRLDFSPTVQDLSDHGFPLAGGRLEYINGRRTAAIVYYRAAHPINLFIWPSTSEKTRQEKIMAREGYHIIRWSEGGMTYWAISDLNERELHDFVGLLRK